MIKIPPRSVQGHKGTFGSLAVIGGQLSNNAVMLGSAVFAAKAAIRSGLGLVYFVGQKQVLIELVKMLPQAVGINIDQIKKSEAVVIGPGRGQSEQAVFDLKKVLELDLPTVIDADALNVLASQPELTGLIHDKCVLTPHPGEFKRLAQATGVKNVEDLAKKLGCCVVLKSHQTKVVQASQIWENKAANPALATGGTGDVLAGLIGGFLAQYHQKLSIFECARLAVEIHSQAGLAWSQKHGSAGLIIDELIDLIPEAIDKFRN